VAAGVGAVIAIELALVLMGSFQQTQAPVDPKLAELGNTRMLGIAIYTDYLYPLQVAAVLLLVAIIAAIALTLRRRKDSRAIDPAIQVQARKAGRLRIIRMPAERAPEASASNGGES
jgi:NADH-quinone oxidoreductase subunit J